MSLAEIFAPMLIVKVAGRICEPLGPWPPLEVVPSIPCASEEERIERKRAAQQRYYDSHREKRLQASKDWKLRQRAA